MGRIRLRRIWSVVKEDAVWSALEQQGYHNAVVVFTDPDDRIVWVESRQSPHTTTKRLVEVAQYLGGTERKPYMEGSGSPRLTLPKEAPTEVVKHPAHEEGSADVQSTLTDRREDSGPEGS